GAPNQSLYSAIYSVTNWAMQGRTFMRTVIAVAVLLMLCVDVRAQTLTECGRSDGYTYLFSGGLVPADKSGWQKEWDDGRTVLNYINREFDLLEKDASGTTSRSVKQLGGKIIPRKTTNGLIAITVFYEGSAGTRRIMLFRSIIGATERWSGQLFGLPQSLTRCR